MKLYIFGAHGQMGTAMQQAARSKRLEFEAFDRQQADVRDRAAVHKSLAHAADGDVVVNAAAVLGTPQAESDPFPQLETNVAAATLVAQAAGRRSAAIVHFSTDYVFDGNKNGAYDETDVPNPVNMYGALKLASEFLVCRANPKHYVLRISSVFGAAANAARSQANFVERMLQAAGASREIEVRDDVVISPTYASDAASAALQLVQGGAPYGVYHCANSGACSWNQFAQAIFQLSGLAATAVRAKTIVDPVLRPKNSALDNRKLAQLGISLRPWHDALAAYLRERDAAPR